MNLSNFKKIQYLSPILDQRDQKLIEWVWLVVWWTIFLSRSLLLARKCGAPRASHQWSAKLLFMFKSFCSSLKKSVLKSLTIRKIRKKGWARMTGHCWPGIGWVKMYYCQWTSGEGWIHILFIVGIRTSNGNGETRCDKQNSRRKQRT